MSTQATAHENAIQGAWQQIVDSASVLAVVEAALDSHIEPPDPSHFMAVLRQTRVQLLEAADRLDRAKDGAEGQS